MERYDIYPCERGLKRLNEHITKQDNIAEYKHKPDTNTYLYAGSLSVIQIYISLIQILIYININTYLFSILSKESIDKERKRHDKAIEDLRELK